MENKLISMTDFVLSKERASGYYESQIDFYDGECKDKANIIAYAQFLKQPLALWMFVPCDENNVSLEEPTSIKWVYGCEQYFEQDKAWKEYKKAKSRVLFEGFEIEKSKSRIGFYLAEYNYIDYSIVQNNFSSPSKYLTTIEDLIIYSGLTLTETAIKSIYGS
ncbi:hypothetical protein [Elizabethkingia ursingii]|uniref:hypothetical protein n=1 Tax=Elizabethkingia ursingii TaxID=1756150 RepID=UPI000751A5C1|nr:hypothetical protein [Elizabethkingia ursingii]KUY28046.1 hypothetical protein ATB96_19615 [Elizabethkingia ursingii]